MNYYKRTSLIGIVVLFMAILAILAPISVPSASAHTLAPLSAHIIRQASEPNHQAVPLSPTNNCNFDTPSQGGFPCAVGNFSSGCLVEHTTPHLGTGNRTRNCYAAGTIVVIVCQTTGDLVNGVTSVWDFLTTSGYVTDFFMDTSGINGAFSPPIPRCGVGGCNPRTNPCPQSPIGADLRA